MAPKTLTAISSFRKLSDNEEVAQNQLRAFESWSLIFDKIILFGKEEYRIDWPQIEFVEADDFPTIRMLALAASFADDMACLINSDIVVAPHLNRTIKELLRRGGNCATSKRYEFDPKTENYHAATVADNGVDFFCAWPDLWQKVVRAIPSTFRLGHCAWDSWMLGFFNVTCPRTFYDLTKHRVIFHPLHLARKRAHQIQNVSDKYTAYCGFPILKL